MLIYEDALEAKGHKVECLRAQKAPDRATYALCHLFMTNGDSIGIGVEARHHLPLVVSPIIDKLYPNILLRLNVLLDRYVSVIYTHIGRCAAFGRMADTLCLISTDEARLAARGVGGRAPAMVVHAAVSSELLGPPPGRFAEYTNKPYVLFLGDAGNPRKNVERIIQAFRDLDVAC